MNPPMHLCVDLGNKNSSLLDVHMLKARPRVGELHALGTPGALSQLNPHLYMMITAVVLSDNGENADGNVICICHPLLPLPQRAGGTLCKSGLDAGHVQGRARDCSGTGGAGWCGSSG